MLTKDFVKEVEKLGFEVGKSMDAILIFYGKGQVSYALINERFHLGMIDGFCDLPEELKEKLYSLMDEYARTPLDEREEEQKYYLKHRKTNISSHYLNVFYGEDGHIVESNMDMVALRSQFTQKEIDEIKNIFNSSFDEFKQIPVEEE